jgi:pimeloyl-ACP methyl ester carboxylesterase
MNVEATAARTRHTITVGDGTEIFFKDWGTGQPIVFSHGSPLKSDAWEDQMVFLADRGYRCIAHDRRGHGRSSHPWTGNDVDTYAADLAALVQDSISTTPFTSATRPAPVKWCGTSLATARHAWRRLFWSAP